MTLCITNISMNKHTKGNIKFNKWHISSKKLILSIFFKLILDLIQDLNYQVLIYIHLNKFKINSDKL